MTEFGVVTQVGRSIFLRVRNAHIPRGRGPTVPKISETPADAERAWTYSDEIWYEGVSHAPFQGGRSPASPKFLEALLPTLKWFDLQRRDLVW